MKLLVIEDSKRLLFSLGKALKKKGYSVDLVADGKDGYDYALYNEYDAIILDLSLPSMDGLTVLKKLRKAGVGTHVLILSARDQLDDRVRGLELGADDYMIKPFSFDELNARISTLVRRKYESKNPELVLGPISINTASKVVKNGESTVKLTPAEYSVLEYLVMSRGRILSKNQLLDAIHDSESYAGPNVIEVLVCKLRAKLGQINGEPIIKTRRGFGYYVDPD